MRAGPLAAPNPLALDLERLEEPVGCRVSDVLVEALARCADRILPAGYRFNEVCKPVELPPRGVPEERPRGAYNEGACERVGARRHGLG